MKEFSVSKLTSTKPGKSLLLDFHPVTLTSFKTVKSHLHTMTIVNRQIFFFFWQNRYVSETTKPQQYLKTNAYVLLMAILRKALILYKPSSASLWFSYFQVTRVYHCPFTHKPYGQYAGRLFFNLPSGFIFSPFWFISNDYFRLNVS